MEKPVIDFFMFDAPWPVSANEMYTYVPKMRQPVRSNKYIAYIDALRSLFLRVRQRGRVQMGEAVCVWTLAYPPRASADLDNINKTLFDSLQHSGSWRGAFADDRYIVSTRQERGQRVQRGLVKVFIAAEHKREQLQAVYDPMAIACREARLADTGKIAMPPPFEVLINPDPLGAAQVCNQ